MTKVFVFLGMHAAGREDIARFKRNNNICIEKLTEIYKIIDAQEVIFIHSSLTNLIVKILFGWKKFSIILHNNFEFQSRKGFLNYYDKLILKTNIKIANKYYFLSNKVMMNWKLNGDKEIIELPIKMGILRKISQTSKILFFGRNLPYKNVNLFYNLSKTNKNINFTIAGSGMNYQETDNCKVINRYINDAEVEELYRNHDVMLFPYLDVTQSGPFYKALENGVWCITAEHPFFLKWKNHKGIIITKENTVESFQVELKKLYAESS